MSLEAEKTTIREQMKQVLAAFPQAPGDMAGEFCELRMADLDVALGVWYTQLSDHIGAMFILADDPGSTSRVIAVILHAESEPLAQFKRKPKIERAGLLWIMRMTHRMVMHMVKREGWELLRGGRTGEEFLEAIQGMPGIRLRL